MNRLTTTARILAVAAGLALASPATAQDASRPPRTVTTAAPTSPREEAVRTMPTYDAFGAGATASTAESSERISRDFSSMAELGARRIGSVPVWPRGDLSLAGIRIMPYLRTGLEWESNFYRTSSRGARTSAEANDSAWTHSNSAGVLADTALAGGRLRLFASMEAEWNLRYDNGDGRIDTKTGQLVGDEKADTFEFDGLLGASYRWQSGVYVRGGLGYQRRAEPIDVDPRPDFFTREFQRTNRRSFLVWGLDRDILFGSKFRFEGGVSTRDAIGRERGLDSMDRTETTYYLKASYPFLRETTRLFGRARYRQDERESKRINDGGVYGFDAGLEGTIPISEGESRGLRGQVYVGFDHALYEDETYTEGANLVTRDENSEASNVAFGAALQYRMSRKSTWDLRLLRQNQFSYHGNYQITNRADLSFNHQLTPVLNGRIEGFYEYDQYAGRISQESRPTFPGDPRIPRTDKYPGAVRFGGGFGLRYRLNDWADLDGSYSWERKNHRFSGFSNHAANVGITVYLSGLRARARTDTDVGTIAPATYSAPSVTAPVTPAPAVTAPKVTAPSVTAPTVTAPAVTAPTVTAPTVTAPTVKPPTVTAPTVTAPAVRAPSVSIPGFDVRTSGSARIDGGSASGAGKVIRIADASGRAAIDLPGGASVELSGPAVLQVVEISATGSRVQLVAGTARVRAGGVAVEIQTPAGPSLVLQNASATAQAGTDGVSFQKTAGDYARVHDGGTATDLGASPWKKR